MSSVNFDISKEDLLYTEELLHKLISEEKKEMSPRENMIYDFLKSFPAYSREEAEETVDQIIEGITTFYNKFQKVQSCDEKLIMKEIKEVTKELTAEEKSACLVNFLLSIKALDAIALKDILKEESSDIEDKLEKLKDTKFSVRDGEIAQNKLNELMELSTGVIKNSGIMIAGNKELVNLVKEIDSNEKVLDEFVIVNCDDVKHKYYAAYSTYKAYLDGKMTSLPKDINAEMISVGVAAGLERTKVMKDVASGSIGWDIAAGVFEAIAVVTSLCLLGWICVQVITAAAIIGAEIIVFAFGGSMLAIFAGMLLGSYIGYKASVIIADVFYETWTIVSDFFSEHIAPTVVSTAENIWRFIDEKIIKGIFGLNLNNVETTELVDG